MLDDPLKAADAHSATRRAALINWYNSSLVSRLNDKKTGAIILVTQRLHADDLVGHLLEQSDEWTHLYLPAIADSDLQVAISWDRTHLFRRGEALHPDREPLEVLDRLRRELGSADFSAQYLQQPVPPGGAMFQRAWIRRYEGNLAVDGSGMVIQSWDTASKTAPGNDWSVCTTWWVKNGNYYLLDLFRQRLDYPGLKRAAIGMAGRHHPRMVLVEDADVGTALATELRGCGIKVSPVRPAVSKEARAAVEAAKFEGGLVHFPTTAPWMQDLEVELFSFPGSRHDDQVDSIVQALAYKIHIAKTTTTFTLSVI